MNYVIDLYVAYKLVYIMSSTRSLCCVWSLCCALYQAPDLCVVCNVYIISSIWSLYFVMCFGTYKCCHILFIFYRIFFNVIHCLTYWHLFQEKHLRLETSYVYCFLSFYESHWTFLRYIHMYVFFMRVQFARKRNSEISPVSCIQWHVSIFCQFC